MNSIQDPDRKAPGVRGFKRKILDTLTTYDPLKEEVVALRVIHVANNLAIIDFQRGLGTVQTVPIYLDMLICSGERRRLSAMVVADPKRGGEFILGGGGWKLTCLARGSHVLYCDNPPFNGESRVKLDATQMISSLLELLDARALELDRQHSCDGTKKWLCGLNQSQRPSSSKNSSSVIASLG